MKLRVSDCGHFFTHDDGTPFFYLADTAWLLFNKLKIEEVETFFADRTAKGFTVIQSVVFRDLFEPNTPNAYGVSPFASEEEMYAVRMNPEWIAWVKEVVALAAKFGLVMGLLPTWGDKWNEHSNSAGPVIMDREGARRYGRFLSDALADHSNVIWILGGDSPIRSQAEADVITAMAEGIRSGGSSDRLMSFHPSGAGTSTGFHNAQWLDFDAMQTSHGRPNIPGYIHIERMYSDPYPKPCLDMEPNYELCPIFILMGSRDRAGGEPVFSAYDVRKAFYRTVLAGAAGFTYGCEPIRQIRREGDRVHIFEGYGIPTWREGLAAPGSSQLRMLPELLMQRSYYTRVPAQELFIPTVDRAGWMDRMGIGMSATKQLNDEPVAHVSVARCREGGYVMAYIPVRQVVTLDTSGLGERIRVTVYNPEACEETGSYEAENNGTVLLVPERDLDSFVIVDSV